MIILKNNFFRDLLRLFCAWIGGGLVMWHPSAGAQQSDPAAHQQNEMVDAISREQFAGAGALWVWQPNRYANFVRQTGPDSQAGHLKSVAVAMAGNEFRDLVFTVGAPDRELALDIVLRPTGRRTLPPQAVAIYSAEYLKNRRGEETGDALLPVNGPVQAPAGQSRQFWVRFDARTVDLSPGQYPFELVIGDEKQGLRKVIPGALEVWDFLLPSYDVLPNNSYAIFLAKSKLGAGAAFRQAVRHMKLYGLNHMFVEPPEVVRPTELDEQWRITGYEDEAVIHRVTEGLDAWNEVSGNDTLNFIFSISGFEELGLQREGYAFPNERWKLVFAQWLDHFKNVLAQVGLDDDQWMLVLRDEADEEVLKSVEIPLAEAIKSLDPSIRITCNTSTILSDESWSMRFFKAFDVFQPHLGLDETLEWLRSSGKPIWVYQCWTDLPVLGKDLHHYYRGYGWDMIDKGFTGTGLWTYYSSPHDRPFYGEDSQGCQLVYFHPEHGLVHSRRYEMFREGMDDYRYVVGLRRAAEQRGAEAVQAAETLIQQAVRDITTHPQDHKRPETWRVRIAERILALGSD